MAELLSFSASLVCDNRAHSLFVPASFREVRVSASAPLQIALPFNRTGGFGSAPVHYMGGGPRTFPGGVTKWQWKRMQLKKSRQIEKARLMREKHIYEARRRAEMLAANPVLEMPWQRMSRIRPPSYVSSDEQITKLASRFQRREGEDLWTEKDGPETFEVLGNESSLVFSPPNLNSREGSPDTRESVRQRHNEQGNGLPPHNQSSQFVQPANSGSIPHLEPQIRPGSTPFPETHFRRRSMRPYR
ncbi:hypothetical protein KP509_39G016900 [Ceratopteris richardii]|uniref:Uncharacterized protein n=1 Tax=Ceratopteris richardii TaxID=49495 RepID=A0A8T2PZ66_CERRI|nr:hypothetical protein KP509_39G016900 [Ceratopteris richardii]